MNDILKQMVTAMKLPLNRTGCRFSGKTFFVAGIIFLLASSIALAGGTIRGKLFDKDSKDPLPGANVVVKGTSLGTSTDIDGAYVIYNVPTGSQVVVGSYVGYISSTITINVTENSNITQDFYLKSTEIEGEAVIVTGQARGQLQAINQQISSDKIVNIVSEERIQELPDFNAAAAISRLPGVSTTQNAGEAQKIVIRGLAPQFNAVAVGGISLASTGSTQIGVTSQGGTSNSINNDRSVDLSMVTPYMIKSIEVYKSLTPDMNANAIGGFVNMELREAPSGIHTDLLWQSGYTQKTDNYGNYRGIASVSDRFFDDKFGIYALVNGEKYDRDADNLTASYASASSVVDTASGYYLGQEHIAGYRPVTVTNITLNRHKEVRQRYGGNVILDYQLPSGSIQSVNMFSRLHSDFKDYNQILDYANNDNIEFRYGAGVSNTDIAVNSLELQNDFGFFSVDLKAANSYSRNNLPNEPFYQFTSTGGAYSGAIPYNTPPEDLISSLKFRGADQTYANNVSLFSTDYKENDQIVKGDIKVPVTLSSAVSGFLKFGGEYRQNNHSNNQNTPFADITATGVNLNQSNSMKATIIKAIQAAYPNIVFDKTVGAFAASSFTSTDSKLYDSFLGNKFGNVLWATDPTILNSMVQLLSTTPAYNAVNDKGATDPGGWYESLFQTLANDYTYVEDYAAGYAMAQVNVGSSLMLVGGARYENVTSTYTAYNLLDGRDALHQTADTVEAHPSNNFLLPMAQVKFNMADWGDLRYSYTQTLARPDYHQLSPHYAISYDHNNVWAGNPDLKTAQAYNHDLILTLHNNELGLFSVGGFYKEIKDFTFYTSYKLRSGHDPKVHILPGLDSIESFSALGSPPKDGATLYTYVNSRSKAYVRGLEFDLQTRFYYLPFPFDGLLLGVNYTHIWSKAYYPYRDEKTSGKGTNLIITQIDSTREGRLINQPDDIANAYVGWDYKGFSAKVSFVFQGNSVSYIGSIPEQDGFTADYYRVDASVRQMLPIPGLQLFLDVTNLNNRNNISAQQSFGGFTNEQNYGLTANLGIRYTFGM